MGKKSNWFRKLFGGGRKKQSHELDTKPGGKDKKNQLCSSHPYDGAAECSSSSSYTTGIDASKHAIVVAAATAAVAEAAVAAAKAAAEVVRLTSGPGRFTTAATSFVGSSGRFWEIVAAVKIQSAFRAYLARRALRALKALVKLQALVRGHIVRKQTADTLRCMQSLVRVQARARASRAHLSESSQSSNRSSLTHHHTSSGPVKYNHQTQTKSNKVDLTLFGNKYGSNLGTNESCQGTVRYGSNWLDRWMKESSAKGYAHDDETDKILEIDTCKPNFHPRQSNRISQKSDHGVPLGYYDRPSMPFFPQNHIPNMPFADSSSLSSLIYQNEKDEATSWTAENSPQVFSASSRPGSSARRSAFSPTKSEFSRSLFKGYAVHPNYMANTESYRAKVRSQSAPRQRVELEKFGSTRRSVHGFSNMMATTQDYEDLRH